MGVFCRFTDVLPMDIDNDHTDDPAEYISEQMMEEIFPDVDYVLVPSRSHNKPKGSRPAAPRYHVYFPITKNTDGKTYAAMKKKLQAMYPFFDSNALDEARFLYGSKAEEVVWHEGWMSIEEDLTDLTVDTDVTTNEEFDAPVSTCPILEGSRNKTMSHFAGRVLKRYGLTFTIMEVKSGKGSAKGWGRLKSGAGWISLDYGTRI